jgi:leucyl aminopeptidase (aminopeptidase T)
MENRVPVPACLAQAQIVMAPTQLSATAPLKLLAREYNFRAATMPGFSSAMMPALRIDYREVNRRVDHIKEVLSLALAVDIRFTVDGQDRHQVHFDLRHREGHASGGRYPKTGVAGNLPSGESYIVPYEGERGDISESSGVLPVQLDNEVVCYRIERNKAVDILSRGSRSREEARRILDEPAYANIAELGFGVLGDFGLEPVGEILLDEKLGLHVAFGRSDHFGGAVGVKDFSSPEAVVHVDRIYIPETAPRIHVDFVRLTDPEGDTLELMKNGRYTPLLKTAVT